jgi:hypothetical protein
MSRSVLLPGRLAAGLLLAAGFLAGGCGVRGTPAGQVEGQVSLRGQPVTRGNVNFLLKEKGVGAVAAIDGAGKYAFAAPLEAGTYAVYVTPMPPEPAPPGTATPRAAPEIPARYQDPSTSGLSCTVKHGRNELPIALGD